MTTKYTEAELQEIIRYHTWRDPLHSRRRKDGDEGTDWWEDVSEYRPNFPNWVRLKRKQGHWVAHWVNHSSEVGPDMLGGKGFTLYFDGSTVYQGYKSSELAMAAGMALLMLVAEKEKDGK